MYVRAMFGDELHMGCNLQCAAQLRELLRELRQAVAAHTAEFEETCLAVCHFVRSVRTGPD